MSTLNEPMPPFSWQEQDPPGAESALEPEPRYEAPAYHAAGKLAGQVALITGGDSGIGRAVACLYAREGADVALVYLPEEQKDAEETRAAVEHAGQEALLLAGDVGDPAFCARAVGATVGRFGRLDILVNNAAEQHTQENVEDLRIEQWERTFRTNIHGYFFMVRAALPHMTKGCIINTGSIAGMRGSAGRLDYASTKGAIHAFTKTLAQMLQDRDIRVNCVAPGPVWTPLNPADRDGDDVAHFGEGRPYGRPAQPEEIAPAYVFLASTADSSYITGEVLSPLGGEMRSG